MCLMKVRLWVLSPEYDLSNFFLGEIILIEKEDLISLISNIRRDIGHKEVEVEISNLFFDEKEGNLLIITPDRPEKSVVIGKGGWVVGRLREELGVNSIHVEAYSDFIVPQYRMKLALAKLEEIITKYPQGEKEPLVNLSHFLKARIENPYQIDTVLGKFQDIFLDLPDHNESHNEYSHKSHNISNDESNDESNHKSVVALSGGVDSSTSLIIAKMLGFKPLAVTVNPGDIIMPRYFRESVGNLTRKLGVEHHYLDLDMQEIIDGSLEGRFHPCGKCSNAIEETILKFTQKNKIPFLIYGDLLSTGAQSIQFVNEFKDNSDNLRVFDDFKDNSDNLGVVDDFKDSNHNLELKILRINLPAMLCLKKGDVKNIAGKMGILKKGGYGCPLIGEVHRKHPHMRRFSIQRVLRETRSGALEPGEALSQINSIL